MDGKATSGMTNTTDTPLLSGKPTNQPHGQPKANKKPAPRAPGSPSSPRSNSKNNHGDKSRATQGFKSQRKGSNEHRESPWDCFHCQNSNHGFRELCNYCGTHRSQTESMHQHQPNYQQHNNYMNYGRQNGYQGQGGGGVGGRGMGMGYAPYMQQHMDHNNPYANQHQMWGDQQQQYHQHHHMQQRMYYAQQQGMPYGYAPHQGHGQGQGQHGWDANYGGYAPQADPNGPAYTEPELPSDETQAPSTSQDEAGTSHTQGQEQVQASAPSQAPQPVQEPQPLLLPPVQFGTVGELLAQEAAASAGSAQEAASASVGFAGAVVEDAPSKKKKEWKASTASTAEDAAAAAGQKLSPMATEAARAPPPAPAPVAALEEELKQVALSEPGAAPAVVAAVAPEPVGAVSPAPAAEAPTVVSTLAKGSSWGKGKLAFSAVVSAPAPAPAPAAMAAHAPPVAAETSAPPTAPAAPAQIVAVPVVEVPVAPPAPAPAPAVELAPLSMQDFRQKCRTADEVPAPPAAAGSSKIAAPNRRLRGLVNSGNTCFRNAILQCLLAATPLNGALQKLVMSFRHRKEIPTQLSAWPELLGFVYSMQMSGSNSCGSGVTALAPVDVRSTMPFICAAFRRKMALDGDESIIETPAPAPALIAVDADLDPLPGATRSSAGKKPASEHSRQEDAMEFLEFLMDFLREEEQLDLQEGEVGPSLGGAATDSMGDRDANAVEPDKEWEEASSWATVTKPGMKEVVDDESRQAAVLSAAGNLISRLFSIRIRAEVAHGQRKTNATFTTLLHLSLALAYSLPLGNVTLSDALDSYFRESIANGSTVDPAANAWGNLKGTQTSKDKEDKKKEVRTRDRLDSLPPVLIFQLKRFNYDRRLGTAVKVHRAINYPEVLTLKTEYFSQDLADSILRQQQPTPGGKKGSSVTSLEKTDIKYRLCGIVLHHGEAITSGHYTAIVATGEEVHPYARIDDVNITRFTTAQALSAQSEVYVLMYQKI